GRAAAPYFSAADAEVECVLGDLPSVDAAEPACLLLLIGERREDARRRRRQPTLDDESVVLHWCHGHDGLRGFDDLTDRASFAPSASSSARNASSRSNRRSQLARRFANQPSA